MPGAPCSFFSEDLADEQVAARNARLNRDIQANLRLPSDKQRIVHSGKHMPLCSPNEHLSSDLKESLREIASLYQSFSLLPLEVQFTLIMFGYLQSTEAQKYCDAIVKYLGYARGSTQATQLKYFQNSLTAAICWDEWVQHYRADSGEVSMAFLWRHTAIDPAFDTLTIGGILRIQNIVRMYAVPRRRTGTSAFPLFYVGCFYGHCKGVVRYQVACVKLHLDEIAELGSILHGTSFAAATQIDASGMLHPMNRNAVHFHSLCNLEKSVRHGKHVSLGWALSNVFYILDAKRFIEAGFEVRQCLNGVIYVPSYVPVTYLKKMINSNRYAIAAAQLARALGNGPCA